MPKPVHVIDAVGACGHAPISDTFAAGKVPPTEVRLYADTTDRRDSTDGLQANPLAPPEP
ncbi:MULTISPECIES: hypothetical protein [unclassified Streptomyces]|uniref:hypothetical protein n=1 Tax=unclassified Streptomyces TaxID=2593676 RepID=UPI00380AFB6F